MEKILQKSATQRVLFGVCGGLAEYFEIDVTIVRIVFVLLSFSGGIGFLLYIALLFIMPDHPDGPVHNFRVSTTHRTRNWFAAGLIIVGLLILVDNLNLAYSLLPGISLGHLIFPLVIIYIGFWLLSRKKG